MKTDFSPKKADTYLEKLRRYFHQNTDLADEAINAVISVSTPREYKKGEFFSKQGEIFNKLAYVCSGLFKVFHIQEDGSFFVVRFLKENDFVQSTFDVSTPGILTNQALCDTIVVEAPLKVINDIYLKYPQLESHARYRIEKYLVTNAFHMIQIGTNKALDNYLLFQKDYDGYEHLIPQHLIAAYLGITPTQLSRIKKTLSGAQQTRKRNKS
jgi:CRP-like cAMP-binding protein